MKPPNKTEREHWRVAERVAWRAVCDLDKYFKRHEPTDAEMDDVLEKTVIRLYKDFALGEMHAQDALRKARKTDGDQHDLGNGTG